MELTELTETERLDIVSLFEILMHHREDIIGMRVVLSTPDGPIDAVALCQVYDINGDLLSVSPLTLLFNEDVLDHVKVGEDVNELSQPGWQAFSAASVIDEGLHNGVLDPWVLGALVGIQGATEARTSGGKILIKGPT